MDLPGIRKASRNPRVAPWCDGLTFGGYLLAPGSAQKGRISMHLIARKGNRSKPKSEASDRQLRGAWYPDPFDKATMRWWDGQKWTDVVRETADGQPTEPETAKTNDS